MPGVAHDLVDDGLSADGQQALGQVVGVGAHAFALAGNRQNDLHIIPSSGLLEFSKQQQYCGVNVEKCLQLCEGRLRQRAMPPLARWGNFLKVPYNGWGGGVLLQKNVKRLKTGLNAEACGLFG